MRQRRLGVVPAAAGAARVVHVDVWAVGLGWGGARAGWNELTVASEGTLGTQGHLCLSVELIDSVHAKGADKNRYFQPL